ncbi:MAG: hypothetical protein Q8R28_08405 [Dehalococcoidia bacterium]|nr:hypothetical protein [Dehalococcoidia bacterium]
MRTAIHKTLSMPMACDMKAGAFHLVECGGDEQMGRLVDDGNSSPV